MPRYIDKDKLIERMRGKKSVEWFNEIYEMEEADVQEVKHGKWKSTGFYGFRCSLCHEHVCMPDDHMAKYCPECGARMDGDGE